MELPFPALLELDGAELSGKVLLVLEPVLLPAVWLVDPLEFYWEELSTKVLLVLEPVLLAAVELVELSEP